MRYFYLTLFAFSLCVSASVRAELAVVVNPDSGVTAISQNDVINIFMGRYRKLPGGSTALPVDYEPLKRRFYRALVNKELAEINAYWARLTFSGQSSPPQQLPTADDVIDVVSQNRGAIAYMDRDDVTDQVRVVLVLSEES